MRLTVTLGIAIVMAAIAGGQASSAQTRQLNEIMRQKLERSKNILEAVVTSDWEQLERESRELARAAEDPAWSVLRIPAYLRQSEAFLQATEDLIEAAGRRDLETASLGYIALTTSCVSCHQHVARSWIAK